MKVAVLGLAFALSAPLAPVHDNGAKTETVKPVAVKKQAARLTQAAICTEDISQIKFQEYSVDWSKWMKDVGQRWSAVFNAGYTTGKFHTDGPAFVQFTCTDDGTITAIELAKSSGDIMCDRSQVEALVNCVPLPAFPAGSAKKTITLLYVWEYGHQARLVKTAKASKQHRIIPDGQRMSISGRLM